MNKEEIERIALEVADSITAPFISDEIMTRFAHRFLARIDAELGKDAVAWWDGQYNDPRFSLTAHSFGTDERPLFLSPTTPEGMALCRDNAGFVQERDALALQNKALEKEVENWSADFIRISDNYSEEAKMNMDFGAERLAFILKEQKQAALIEKCGASIELFLERVEAPDASCSCCIRPPCNDCVEYGGLREALQDGKEALAAIASHKKGGSE